MLYSTTERFAAAPWRPHMGGSGQSGVCNLAHTSDEHAPGVAGCGGADVWVFLVIARVVGEYSAIACMK